MYFQIISKKCTHTHTQTYNSRFAKMLTHLSLCQPTPVLLPRRSHGRMILVGYGPWGRKESGMTERLHSVTQGVCGCFL